jgi:hypothetical protein
LWFAALLALLPAQEALAWDQEGHSIIGEIAQREMKQSTRDAIDNGARRRGLQAVQEIGSALRMRGDGKDRALIAFQNR